MLEEILWIAGIILVGAALFAWLDWTSWNPPKWVVTVRRWMNKMKQAQVGMILLLALLALAIGCAILTGFVALTELKPWAGHIA